MPPLAGSHAAPGWALPAAGRGASAPQGCPGLAVRGQADCGRPSFHFRFCLAPPFCVVFPFLVMTRRELPKRKRLRRAVGGAQLWIRSAWRLPLSGSGSRVGSPAPGPAGSSRPARPGPEVGGPGDPPGGPGDS